MNFLRIRAGFFGFVALIMAAGCGLSPAFDEPTRTALAQVHVLPIAEREGQVLKSALNRQLNPSGLKIGRAYELELQVQTTVAQSFSDATGLVRRARGTFAVIGQLRTLEGQVLWSGSRSRSSLFAQHELPSLAQQAQDDLWEDLADLVAQDLIFDFARALRTTF